MSGEKFYQDFKRSILSIPGLPLMPDDQLDEHDEDPGYYYDSLQPSKVKLTKTQQSLIRQKQTTISTLRGENSLLAGKFGGLEEEEADSLVVSQVDLATAEKRLKSAMSHNAKQDSKLRDELAAGASQSSPSLVQSVQKLHSRPGSSLNRFILFKVSDVLGEMDHSNPEKRKRAIKNLFKYRRGPNVLEPGLCALYSPNDRISRLENPVEHLRCTVCRKSMNSHIHLKFKIALSDLSLSYHQRIRFYDEMVSDTDLVLLFAIGSEDCLGQRNPNSESALEMLFQHLATHGLKLVDVHKMDAETTDKNLYRRYFIDNCPLEDKQMFEDYLQNPLLQDAGQATRVHEVGPD